MPKTGPTATTNTKQQRRQQQLLLIAQQPAHPLSSPIAITIHTYNTDTLLARFLLLLRHRSKQPQHDQGNVRTPVVLDPGRRWVLKEGCDPNETATTTNK